MSSASETWFPDARATTDAEVRFLARLRELAPNLTPDGLSADRSDSVPVPKPLVGVELPHLTSPLRWLWILFLDPPDGLAIDCQWGDHTRFNDWGLIDGDIYPPSSIGMATPEELAEESARWVTAQARRAVRRDEWAGRHPRTRWTFVDTGAVLADTRPSLGRRRGEADDTQIEQAAT